MKRQCAWIVAMMMAAALVAVPTTALADGRSPAVREGSAVPLVARSSDSLRHVEKLPPSKAAIARRKTGKVLKAKLRVSDTTIDAGTRIVVSTKGSRAKRGLRKLIIRFGDGTRTTAKKARVIRRHTYAKPGVYTIRLIVRDRRGKVARAKQSIFVAVKQRERGFGAQWPSAEDAISVAGNTAPGAAGAGAGAPTSVDLRGSAVAVGNQGQIGSCVSWTTAYAMMGWYYRRTTGQSMAFAPMYVYSQTYSGLGADGQPNGSYAKDALEVLRSQGVDTAAHYGAGWATNWATKPNASQRANAARYRLSGWNLIFRHSGNAQAASVGPSAAEIELLKSRLAVGNPVAIAFRVRQDFMGYHSGWYAGSGGLTNGLHEMLALGYDANGLYIQNSWGTGHGVSGYTYMTWSAVKRDLYEATFADGVVFNNASTADTVKPRITAFGKQFAPGHAANNSQAPMTLSWSGADNTGVTQYLLYYRVAGGEWTQLPISKLQRSVTYNLGFGWNYEFAVAAYDAAGNLSDWALSGGFKPANYNETVASYSGSWSAYTNSQYMNGQSFASAQSGAQMSVQVTGTSFGLVGTQWSGGGRAHVYLDGAFQFTIDNYSATTRYRTVVAWFNFSDGAAHQIRVVAEGTSGRPTVDIDSFLLA